MVEFSFECISGGQGKFDVIFIHGLSGDPRATWTAPGADNGADAFWPGWICADLAEANVYLLGYPTDIIAPWLKGEMSLYERSKAVLEHLASLGLGRRPTAIVAHSLGGLLAKQLLRTGTDASDDAWKAIARSVKLICFLATPHSGSTVASAVKLATPRLASKTIQLLESGGDQLVQLNEWYRNFANGELVTVAYYEKHPIKTVMIVDAQSADPGVAGTMAIPIDADHVTICKPSSRESPVYCGVLRHLGKLADTFEAARNGEAEGDFTFAREDYVQKTNDRRDLLQKLIDAHREHEYSIANEAQNRFARNYIRLGLHTSARTHHDNLLADIQQRFETHVYHGQICKGASDADAEAALQSSVIDPVVARFSSQGVTNRTVMEGLYYLTEQCHIRWDAA